MSRTIEIDESRCDGCGLCVDACHEGALALVDGKAKLVRPNFCDGMGDCLPACPRDAISFVEDRPAKDNGPIIPSMSMGGSMMAVPGEQWPIQLALVSPKAGFLKGTLVIAADCTAFKAENFRERFVGDRPMVIGCPKLDDRSRFDKLIEMFRSNPIDKVDIIRMEVPCCGQLIRLVNAAVQMSGRDIPVSETVIGRDGRTL